MSRQYCEFFRVGRGERSFARTKGAREGFRALVRGFVCRGCEPKGRRLWISNSTHWGSCRSPKKSNTGGFAGTSAWRLCVLEPGRATCAANWLALLGQVDDPAAALAQHAQEFVGPDLVPRPDQGIPDEVSQQAAPGWPDLFLSFRSASALRLDLLIITAMKIWILRHIHIRASVDDRTAIIIHNRSGKSHLHPSVISSWPAGLLFLLDYSADIRLYGM